MRAAAAAAVGAKRAGSSQFDLDRSGPGDICRARFICALPSAPAAILTRDFLRYHRRHGAWIGLPMRGHRAMRRAGSTCGLLVATAGLLMSMASCHRAATPAGPSPALPGIESMLADKILGNAGAPVSIIEYSSLNCSHCASFHALTLPQIKTAYLDTGKARLIYRDFPLSDDALSASMVARCAGDAYFTVVDLLFNAQGAWASSSNPTAAIKALVAPAGLSASFVDACLASADLRAGILRMKNTGSADYAVTGTPTFVIGSDRVLGAQPFATFDAILKRLTQ
jgi:protein-disulfide isomerase